MTAFEKLCEIVAKLRAPGGCPWDREQTHESLLPALIEEAYEVAGAVRANDTANFREELGDLLLLIVMHAQIASESGRFDINAVLKDVTEKLIRRHPHVFGNSDAPDSGAVLKQWESIKRAEKKHKPGRNAGDAAGHYLDDLPLAFPALMRAQKTQSKVARVNFDWTELGDVIAKVEEEIQELNWPLRSGIGILPMLHGLEAPATRSKTKQVICFSQSSISHENASSTRKARCKVRLTNSSPVSID